MAGARRARGALGCAPRLAVWVARVADEVVEVELRERRREEARAARGGAQLHCRHVFMSVTSSSHSSMLGGSSITSSPAAIVGELAPTHSHRPTPSGGSDTPVRRVVSRVSDSSVDTRVEESRSDKPRLLSKFYIFSAGRVVRQIEKSVISRTSRARSDGTRGRTSRAAGRTRRATRLGESDESHTSGPTSLYPTGRVVGRVELCRSAGGDPHESDGSTSRIRILRGGVWCRVLSGRHAEPRLKGWSL